MGVALIACVSVTPSRAEKKLRIFPEVGPRSGAIKPMQSVIVEALM